MKIYILLLISMLMAGCTENGSENDVNPEASYRTIIIEGHEYIFISRRPWSGEMALSHKANCKSHN